MQGVISLMSMISFGLYKWTNLQKSTSKTEILVTHSFCQKVEDTRIFLLGYRDKC